MKVFLIELAILSLVALIVAATFFRSRRATEILRRIRLVGWAYVVMVIVLAGIQAARAYW
ncbi:MAG: hypothetical protein LC118_10165 [Dehalococcoidia bacterium]|nr:hypothetical protein [Dehalococcoidia bacterium]